ncbi:hypothetical protein GCK72_000617 [Caenorhabditis remanei]|uniref:F-box domain-containing protein n=1 Tax=Caenorhabditis remanei TaxID=31234 RepID=A0A6A5HQC2_CAERE|nr:hypothetical protein GCK72_000617 [Caenorhabditis remanei]KAF1768804.1 hypothetical protein GCK72_000617 [Caenorhabditis remanei]
MNPIRLFNFPYVVQREIMDSMDLHTIFLLSICSKRMNNLIVSVEKARFNKIKYILYKLTNFVSIEAVNYDHTSEVILTMDTTHCNLMNKKKKLYISDTLIESKWYTARRTKTAFADEVFESVQRHSYGLFGDNKECKLDINIYAYGFRLPKLKNVSGSNIHIVPSVDGKTLNDYFSASPNQDFINLSGVKPCKLKGNSKLYDINCIYTFDDKSKLVPNLLRKFGGRHAFIRTSKLDHRDVIQFLKKWKSNESFEKLEILQVTLRDNSDSEPMNPVEIKNAIDIKMLSESVNSPVYNCKTRLVLSIFRTNPL